MTLSIVIAVNKKDVWFCRLCVASIRFYYPEVPIFLLKDELNGRFSTAEIEKHFNVGLIEYPVKKFGWSAAKMHFYVDERFKGQQFLVIDSDIVFIGKLLDQPFVKEFTSDVIVSEEKISSTETEWFKDTYYDYRAVRAFDPSFQYNGYTFNCGQLFCKGGFLKKETLATFFDFDNYPPWKRADIFPLVDQSLFNYLLPKLSYENKIKIGRENYMLWSESEATKNISFDLLKGGESYPFLIHWAGALRTPLVKLMTRSDILIFFENYYYSKIPSSNFLKFTRKILPQIHHKLHKVYRLLRNKH